MKNLLILLITVTLSSNIYAQATNLKKGDLAPYNGVLIDHKTVRDMRTEVLERDAYKVENDSLKRSMKLQDLNLKMSEKQVEILTKSNDRLADRLEKTTSTSSWEKVLWFGLGVIGTGLAVKAAGSLK